MTTASILGQPASGERPDLLGEGCQAGGRGAARDDPRAPLPDRIQGWADLPEPPEAAGSQNLWVSSWYAISGTAMA